MGQKIGHMQNKATRISLLKIGDVKLFVAKRCVVTGIVDFKLFFGVSCVIVEIERLGALESGRPGVTHCFCY